MQDFAAHVRVRRPDLSNRNNYLSPLSLKWDPLNGHPMLSVEGFNGPCRWGPVIQEDGTPFLLFARQAGRTVTSDMGVQDTMVLHDMTIPTWMPVEAEVSSVIQGTKPALRISNLALRALYDRVGEPGAGGEFVASTLRPRLSRGCIRKIDGPVSPTFLFYLALE